MTKPTKAKLIQLRESSYHEQPVECCGTCRHFSLYSMTMQYSVPRSGRVESRCEAITLRGDAVRKDVSYLGKCDLYEPRKDGAK